MLKIDFALCMKFDRRIHIFMYIYVYIYMQICEKYQVFRALNCRLLNTYTHTHICDPTTISNIFPTYGYGALETCKNDS